MMGTALALNQWHYVGASYDYATGVESVWVDGARVAEKNIGAGVSLATQEDARMGSTSVNGLNFRGRLTRMQVYDVALTAEQIEEVKEDGRGNAPTACDMTAFKRVREIREKQVRKIDTSNERLLFSLFKV